jgi:hypothetical protein
MGGDTIAVTVNRVTALIVVAALVAVAVVVIARAGGDDKPKAAREASAPAAHVEAHGNQSRAPELPADPDDVRGTDPSALTRPANLRQALALLERRRARVRGVLDDLRIAPGRIDTEIVRPDDRRTSLQIRADLQVAFESTHDFPTRAGFRKLGLTARDVEATAPARLLRGIDRQRSGSAAHDLDYIVISRHIIDFTVDVNAYMRLRTPRPRYFRLEGHRVEAIG